MPYSDIFHYLPVPSLWPWRTSGTAAQNQTRTVAPAAHGIAIAGVPAFAPAQAGDFAQTGHVTLDMPTDEQHRLQKLQQDLAGENGRDTHPQKAAEALNRILTRVGAKAFRPGRDNLRDLPLLTRQDVFDMAAAAGFPADAFSRATTHWALAGALESTATLPAAVLGNVISNLCTALTDGSQAARIGGTAASGAVLLGMPPLSALLQIPLTVVGDKMRSTVATVVPDRQALDGSFSKSELAADLRKAAGQFEEARDALLAVLRPLEAALAADPGHALAPHEETALQHLLQTFADASARLETELCRAGAKRVADEHQHKGNHYQSYLRWLKSVMPPVTQLLRALGFISPWAGFGLQLGSSLGTSAAQAVCAGWDEQAKTLYALQAWMLRNPPVTAEGLRRLRAGEPVRAEDVDAARLAQAFRGPVQARVAEVRKVLQDTMGHHALYLAQAGLSPSRRTQTEAARDAIDEDLRRLDAGDIAALTPGGDAARLLAGEGRIDPLLRKEIEGRYRKAGNLMAQTLKYLGQQWQLVVVGPGLYQLAPKIANAARAGKPPPVLMAAFAVFAAALNVLGCKAFAPVAIASGELQFRVESGDAGGWLQVLQAAGLSVTALPLHHHGRHTLRKAERDARHGLASAAPVDGRVRALQKQIETRRGREAARVADAPVARDLEAEAEEEAEEFHDALTCQD